MTRAERYAEWLVNNKDKAGTAEFEKVANAYRQIRAEEQSAQAQEADIEELKKSEYADKPWTSIAQESIGNIPSSAYNLGKGLVEAVASPIDTVTTLGKLGYGILQMGADKLGGQDLVNAIGRSEDSQKIAEAVGKFYVDRYGSEEGVKKAIAQDPVGVMGDFALALKGAQVATLPLKAGGTKLASVPTNLGAAAAAVEPLNAAMGIAKGIPLAAAEGFGAMTGTGGLPVREAFKAGMAGGKKSESFTDAMRGVSDPIEVVEQFKANLAEFRDRRNRQYTQMMATHVSPDPTVLSFNGVDDAITKALGRVTYKGQITDAPAADALNKAWAIIDEWKKLDPREFHTPEGMDQLKQKIGSVVQNIPMEQKNARQAINDLYNSIKSEISKQAPEYSRIMKGYTDATDLIRQIEQSLSMGSKASADTQLRKLTSVMRNNVNTNYGARTKLVNELEGQPYSVMPALAGQTMSNLAPRGIQMGTSPLASMGAYQIGGLPAVAGVALASSPRVVGEAAHLAGRMSSPIAKGARMTIDQVDEIINAVPQLEYLKYVASPEVRYAMFMQVQQQAAQQQAQER